MGRDVEIPKKSQKAVFGMEDIREAQCLRNKGSNLFPEDLNYWTGPETMQKVSFLATPSKAVS